jgi:hypothetical protein
MDKINENNLIIELKKENNSLLNELLIARNLLEKQRNCLLNFNNNCNCVQNIDNKLTFNLLENEFKSVFNNNQKNKIEDKNKKSIESESNLNGVLINFVKSFKTNNKTINDFKKSNEMKQTNEKFNQNIVRNKRLINNNKTCIESKNNCNKKVKIGSKDEYFDESIDDIDSDHKSEDWVKSGNNSDTDSDYNKDYKDLRKYKFIKRHKVMSKESLLEGLRLKVIVEERDPENDMIFGIKESFNEL